MAKGKKGQVLLLALMIMFVGAIILTGLFQYLGSSLLLATRGEENAVNYYAADSGIEDAIYWLQHKQEDEGLWLWNEVEEQWERVGYTLNYTNSTANNRAVDVIVENNPSGCGDNCYSINSTATHNKSGASTSIVSYVRAAPLEFWEFGKDAITSNYDVTILGVKGLVQGNVSYVNDISCTPVSKPCAVNGTITQFEDGIPWWPDTWAITEYFLEQVEDAEHITGDYVIDLIDPENATLGPLYVEGDLFITSSSKEIENTTLNGVIYVGGDLNIGGAKEFTLDFSDQVIFVENKDAIIGDAVGMGNAEVMVDGKCTLVGSGAIFAIGDIWLEPKLSTSPEDFLFIMSIEGWVNMQPSGDFYGSIAGYLEVEISPDDDITRTEGDDFWNTFLDPDPVMLKILTYDIIDR